MKWNELSRIPVKVAGVSAGAMVMGGCSYGALPAVTPPDTFVLENTSSTTPNVETLKSGTVINFYGNVSISGASSETVQYVENASGCVVSGVPAANMIETIRFVFPTTFSFSPDGSFGPTTGLLDTVFSTSATGTLTGAIYTSTCSVFSAPQQVFPNGGTSYEYPGGGNTSVPAGTYYLEFWD